MIDEAYVKVKGPIIKETLQKAWCEVRATSGRSTEQVGTPGSARPYRESLCHPTTAEGRRPSAAFFVPKVSAA